MSNRKSCINCFLSRALDNWLGMIFRSCIDILHCVTIIMFCRWLPSAERLESFNSAAAWRSGLRRSIFKPSRNWSPRIKVPISGMILFQLKLLRSIDIMLLWFWLTIMTLLKSKLVFSLESVTWVTGWWCAASSWIFARYKPVSNCPLICTF